MSLFTASRGSMDDNLSNFIRTSELLEAIPEAIVIINETGHIVSVNQQIEKLFGYHRTQLLGKLADYLLPHRFQSTQTTYREGYFSNLRPTFEDKDFELFGLKLDKTEFPIEINLSPLQTEQGRFTVAAVRDISDRKKMEDAKDMLLAEKLLAKNVELENAILTKDRFLASMSHELRTPLNAIIGFTGILLMRLPGPLTADQQEQLKMVETSAKHLLSIINDILDLAKIESGKVEINLEKMDCEEIIKDVMGTLSPLAVSKKLILKRIYPKRKFML